MATLDWRNKHFTTPLQVKERLEEFLNVNVLFVKGLNETSTDIHKYTFLIEDCLTFNTVTHGMFHIKTKQTQPTHETPQQMPIMVYEVDWRNVVFLNVNDVKMNLANELHVLTEQLHFIRGLTFPGRNYSVFEYPIVHGVDVLEFQTTLNDKIMQYRVFVKWVDVLHV
jgi:hypothetical protein